MYFKMRHFGVIKFLNLVAAILFLVMGIFLLVGFTFNLSVVLELQQAANFDNWKFFILLAGIFALLASGVFTFGGGRDDLHLGPEDGVGEACLSWIRVFSRSRGKWVILNGINLWIWI